MNTDPVFLIGIQQINIQKAAQKFETSLKDKPDALKDKMKILGSKLEGTGKHIKGINHRRLTKVQKGILKNTAQNRRILKQDYKQMRKERSHLAAYTHQLFRELSGAERKLSQMHEKVSAISKNNIQGMKANELASQSNLLVRSVEGHIDETFNDLKALDNSILELTKKQIALQIATEKRFALAEGLRISIADLKKGIRQYQRNVKKFNPDLKMYANIKIDLLQRELTKLQSLEKSLMSSPISNEEAKFRDEMENQMEQINKNIVALKSDLDFAIAIRPVTKRPSLLGRLRTSSNRLTAAYRKSQKRPVTSEELNKISEELKIYAESIIAMKNGNEDIQPSKVYTNIETLFGNITDKRLSRSTSTVGVHDHLTKLRQDFEQLKALNNPVEAANQYLLLIS